MRTHTNGQGHFEIRGLAAGSYTIGVPYGLRYRVDPIELELAAGEKKTAVTLRFKPAVLVNTKGTLDASGKAKAQIKGGPVNAPSALGLVFHHAYLVYDAKNNFYMVSNPVPLKLVK